MDTVVPRSTSTTSPNIHKILVQFVMAGLVIALLWLVVGTVHDRLEAQGIARGFSFLWSRAGFDLSESLVPYDGNDSYARALLAGLSNTLKVAVCSILAAVTIGLVAAAAQLSQHNLARGTARLYVTVVRNTPLLLQLFFWFGIFTFSMPGPRAAVEPLPHIFVSNRGINFPWPSSSCWMVLLITALGLAVSVALRLNADRLPARFAKPAALTMLAVTVIFAVWAGMSGLLQLEFPVVGGFSIRGGGKVTPEFLTLFVGLSVYTGTYIAEAVRGAVLAIPKGQIEAANALGLRPPLVLLLIVIPQAIRIALPAVVSELLNLIKNSSLGVAVGYPDIVSVGNTAMNQTGQAIELIAIYMVVYVAINFTVTKLFALWEHRRVH